MQSQTEVQIFLTVIVSMVNVLRRNTNKTLLVIFQVWQEIPGINPQVSPESTWERGHFFVFFFPLFKLWVTESPNMLKQILADLFAITKKDH